MNRSELYHQLDHWIAQHFDEEVAFLQQLIQVPTDTPPGNNRPHAERTAELLAHMNLSVQSYAVPDELVQQAGMQSITNLLVSREYGAGPCYLLNAHGDVVPPGEGWTVPAYGGEIHDGAMYGRAAAVSKSDFASYTFALRALEAIAQPQRGKLQLLFSYDEEFGGELGPGWMLERGHIAPDYVVAAGFSYQVINAHNACLQMQVTVHGKMAHAAIPDSGVDALYAATQLMQALYAENSRYRQQLSAVPGIRHPYLNIGVIQGGTNTNVVPGKVEFKFDRRMIPEEDPVAVEAQLRQLLHQTAAQLPGVQIEIKRLLLARALVPSAAQAPLISALQSHASAVFGCEIPVLGTPLYTDVRLFAERGIPGVIYGAGPRTVLESHAKRADERLQLADLRRATQVIARSLADWLA